MRVNPVTLMYEDLSLEDIEEMVPVLEKLICKGEVPYPVPAWIQAWMDVSTSLNPNNLLLTISTAFPQRALLSIVLAKQVSGNSSYK